MGLPLVGIGGAIVAEHVGYMLADGADLVKTATGMMWHLLLVAEFRRMQGQG